jgi:C-terminal processing protease CtpA/Prc
MSKLRGLVLSLALTMTGTSPVHSTATDLEILTAQQAKEEINQLVAMIMRYHPDPFSVTPKSEFYGLMDELLSTSDDVSIAEHYFNLSSLLATTFDTHTQLHTTDQTAAFQTTYPLRFRLFPEGLFVVASDDHYRPLLGKRVVTFGDRDALAVIDGLARFAFGEHELRRRVYSESLLYLPETYAALSLVNEDGSVDVVVEDEHGNRLSSRLQHTWNKRPSDFGWDSQNPFLPDELISIHEDRSTEPPFYLQHLDDNYWFRFFDDGKYMYLQVNLPFKKEQGETPMEFHLNWIQALHDSKAEVLIIDLRNNPGGWINLTAPIPGLLSEEYFSHPTLQGVAVLIGPDTVSAGSVLAARLEDAIRPVFIGGPTGSAPNLYLEAQSTVLPYSKLSVSVSREELITHNRADQRRFIAPDLTIENSFSDYLEGKDLILEAAKSIDKETRKQAYSGSSPYTPWARSSQARAGSAIPVN